MSVELFVLYHVFYDVLDVVVSRVEEGSVTRAQNGVVSGTASIVVLWIPVAEGPER